MKGLFPVGFVLGKRKDGSSSEFEPFAYLSPNSGRMARRVQVSQFCLWFGFHVAVAVRCVEARLSMKNMPCFLDTAVMCAGCLLYDNGVVGVVVGFHVPPP